MKSALTRQLKRRRELAQRRNLKSVKPRIAVTEESVSRGRREIVIEPSCQVKNEKKHCYRLGVSDFGRMVNFR